MAIDPRSPCVIGVAQATWGRGEQPAPEPLAMWEQVARAAAADAGVPDAVARIDDLSVVHCQSWAYDDPAARLAERLGTGPGHRAYSILAGTSAQRLVNPAAERMLRGESSLALVVGAEALATVREHQRAGEAPPWSHAAERQPEFPIDLDEWFLPTELAHFVLPATVTFAMYETARRAHLGADPAAYRARLGRLLAPMTEVAAKNPYAWFPTVRTADEIVTPSGENRWVDAPYTKYMVAIMDVDQAAAILLATHEQADALGVPAEQRVYLRGWSFCRDATHVAERPELHASPAMRAASADALGQAGIGIDDVAHLDLYSCFSSSVLFARDALGIADDDDRPCTVTGGLPYAGGPSSNYMGHSIATVVERLRRDPGAHGLVSGVGMHMTKHVFAAYSTEPGPLGPRDQAAVQARVDALGLHPIVDAPEGEATVAMYTVHHGRGNEPEWALAVCDLPGGARCYARTDDADVLRSMVGDEWVGRPVQLHHRPDGTNRLDPD